MSALGGTLLTLCGVCIGAMMGFDGLVRSWLIGGDVEIRRNVTPFFLLAVLLVLSTLFVEIVAPATGLTR